MSVELARECLNRARSQLERVQAATYDPDPEDAILWAFYAYENCVVALAEMNERNWEKNHFEKARLARDFHNEGLVSRDIGDFMEELNRLRKDAAYDELGEEIDLEDLSSGLEGYIEDIEARLDSLK